MSALTSLLVRDQRVPVRKIEEAIQRQVISGGRLDTVLLELKLVPENVLSAYLGVIHDLLPATRDEVMKVSRDVVRMVPKEVAAQHRMVPLSSEDRTLCVAVADPLDAATEAQLGFLLGAEIVQRVVTTARISAGLHHHYGVDLIPRMRRLIEKLRQTEPGAIPYVAPLVQNVAEGRTGLEDEYGRDEEQGPSTKKFGVVASVPAPPPVENDQPVRVRPSQVVGVRRSTRPPPGPVAEVPPEPREHKRVAIPSSPLVRAQKLSDALHKIMAEDPSVRIEHDATANETVLFGNGDLHLRLLLEKMKQTFNVEVSTRPPSVPYRETITRPAEGHHRHKKQTGGAGQFGEVFLKVEPAPRGEGFAFINKVVGGSIPSQFIPAVEKGVRQVLDSGAIAGYPLQDVRVTVYDGKHHSVDSKEVAFVAAGKKAFIDAIQKARPIILEPIVNMHISAPSDSIGTITGDLSGMRGRILDQQVLPGNQATVDGQAPLAETISYYSTLKAHTSGEGVYTLEFSHYEAVPSNIQQELVSKYKRAEED